VSSRHRSRVTDPRSPIRALHAADSKASYVSDSIIRRRSCPPFLRVCRAPAATNTGSAIARRIARSSRLILRACERSRTSMRITTLEETTPEGGPWRRRWRGFSAPSDRGHGSVSSLMRVQSAT